MRQRPITPLHHPTRFRLSSARTWCALVLLLAAALGAGCKVLRPKTLDTPPLAGLPGNAEVLHDLAAYDRALEAVFARGVCVIESPEFEGRKSFDAAISFQRPDRLHIEGRHRPTHKRIFNLVSIGGEYLVESYETNEKWHSLDGNLYQSVPFSVSPSDIARELFLPEPWSALPPRQFLLTGIAPGEQAVTARVLGPGGALRREVTLEGPPWRVVESVRFEDGAAVARTKLGDYRNEAGILVPYTIATEFPYEATSLNFRLRQVRPNAPLDPARFQLPWRSGG